ncbi:hypothetical protein [Mycolicibacterium gilvum]|uniref:Transmembrane protein n=1 Tax=Mycolicibacterium gilvum TaxID=1804 RepID=A0A378SM47_9MYCO|nr:hypothetical protein [Mycolicibacterium gilvum]MCV7053614.1 hypothetical protein [Mycolicibacterium gilvum]STZ43208.1 Uncharacterised protein [Mycolicibacterium gilvum]
MARRALSNTDSGLAARLAAFASLGAGVIHAAVVPAHWNEWMPAGVFFAAMALAQAGWALLILLRTTAPVLFFGIALNISAIVLWALSRSAGAPFGPHAGTVEHIQGADLCALLLEIYAVMGAGWVWRRGRRGESIPAFANALVSLGAAGVVILASTVGVTSGLRHGHHDAGAGHAEAGSHHAPSAPMPVIKMNDSGPGAPTPPPLQSPGVAGAPPAPSDGHDHHH